jgi:DNA ligase-1
MKPMLARTYGPKYANFPCYVQPKLNGVRALYQQGTFQSRDEKVWKKPVLAHLHTELERIWPVIGELILDGELYVHGWKLQRINGAVAVNRKEPREDTDQVCFHVFDIVRPDVNFSRRWFDLYHNLGDVDCPHIIPVPTAMVVNREDLDMHFHMYTKLGYEGIMLRPDGPYEFGVTDHDTQKRSKFLWKHKQWQDDEFYCKNVTEGEGKADIGIGALVLETKAGHVFKVGTGFSDDERIEFMQRPPLGKLVRVRYLELTEGDIPFNPSFVAVMF